MMQITEDTPPDMLAGAMDLTVHLPNGRVVKMSVERSTPMMDLLVQITTAHHLQQSGHLLQALAMAPTSGIADKILPYKPNAPIGVLDIQHVKVVSKNKPASVVKNSTPNHQPFESTFRLQVHLPRNQLYVIRVSQNVYLGDIMRKVCAEKKLDISKYEFRHPGNLDEVLDPKYSLSDYQITEVYLVSKGTLGLSQAFSSNDIMALRKEEERKQLQARTGGGVFSLIFKRGKTNAGTGSLSSENRSISPSHSEDSRSITPPAVPHILPASQPLDKPKPPQRKRRAAPKPPQQKEEQQKNSNDKPGSHISNSSDISETDLNQKKGDNGLTICHSRNSSDSSGYHEPSVLSDHCNTSLPRRSKGNVSETVAEEIICEKTKVNGNLSNMAPLSRSTVSVAGRKKKAAPLPPPLVVNKPESVAQRPEKASPSVDASITPPAEKPDIPRLQPRTKKPSDPPKPAPRSKYSPLREGSSAALNENKAVLATNSSTAEDSIRCYDLFEKNRYSLPIFSKEADAMPGNLKTQESATIADTVTSMCKSNVEQVKVEPNMKKWSSLNTLDDALTHHSFLHVGYGSVVGVNNITDLKLTKGTNRKASLDAANLSTDAEKIQQKEVKEMHNNKQSISSSTLQLNVSAANDSQSSNSKEESQCASECVSPIEAPITFKLDNKTNVSTNGTSYNSNNDTCNNGMIFNNIPNIPIETDLEKHQSIDKIIEDINDIDWDYQIPPPPSEFRDNSPINTYMDNSPPECSEPRETETKCDKTLTEEKPMLTTLSLENLEKRKSLVYNREISTSLKFAQENSNNDSVDSGDIVNKRSSMLNELEVVIQNGGTKSLTRHVEPPITDTSLPNFKMATYSEPKNKIHIFEDESIRSKHQDTETVFKKPFEFGKYKSTSRNNFYVKHTTPKAITRSESFSSNVLNWKPLNPVQRSKSQVALNKIKDGADNNMEDSTLVKSNSLFDVSGLQSLEVMRVIQTKLNTPSNSVEQLDEHTHSNNTNQSIQAVTKKENESTTLPPKPIELENGTNTKTYHYQGPPAINLSTWSERPKTKISLKEDTDYRISTNNNSAAVVKHNGTDHTVLQKPFGSTVIKINEQQSEIKHDNTARFALNYRKPLANINKNDKSIRPHSVAYEQDINTSRVPIVRAVELKKSFTQINNDNDRYSDMYRNSDIVHTNHHRSTVQRVNSFAQSHPNVVGFRGIEVGNDNTARSRKSWNVPNSYTLPTKIVVAESPLKMSNYTPNTNVPFSQLSLKRVDSTRVTNESNIAPTNLNRYSNGNQFVLKSNINPIKPIPPPMPLAPLTSKKPVTCNGNSEDPRNELLNSIRNFGGSKGLRHVKA